MIELLLEHGADANQQSNGQETGQETPLHAAVQSDQGTHTEVIQLLLDHNANPNAALFDIGVSALFTSVDAGNVQVTEMLLNHHADPNMARTDNGGTALAAAAVNGDLAVGKLLLRHNADANVGRAAGVDGVDSVTTVPLWLAAMNGHTEFMKLLLENHADPEIIGGRSSTSLLWYATDKKLIGAVRVLLEYNADPNTAEATKGKSALWIAVDDESHEMVEMLLAAGADPNTAEISQGISALWKAAMQNDLKAVEMLLEAGADPNYRASMSNVPYTLITPDMNPVHTQVSALLTAAQTGRARLTRLLLKHNADPNLEFSHRTELVGVSPLWEAVRHGAVDVVKALLEHNYTGDNAVDVNKPNKYDGLTPLANAVSQLGAHPPDAGVGGTEEMCQQPLGDVPDTGRIARIEIVKLLLKHNADPNVGLAYTEKPKHISYMHIGFSGNTPLHIAALLAETEVLQLLLEHSADPNQPNDVGVTPLFVASRRGAVNLVRILLENNADPNIRAKAESTRGGTPLTQAAREGHINVVRALLQGNANPNIPESSDNGRWTPYEIAVAVGFKSTQLASAERYTDIARLLTVAMILAPAKGAAEGTPEGTQWFALGSPKKRND